MVKFGGLLLLPIISILTPPLIAQNTSSFNQTSLVENTTISLPISEESYRGIIVKLIFGLEEEKVPEYLIRVIYNSSNASAITSEDINALYSIGNLSLDKTIDIIEKLGYNSSNLLSVYGLEIILKELGLPFKNFYSTIFFDKLNVTGVQLRNFLEAFHIPTPEFSDSLTFGVGDPLEIFKQGNFNESNALNAYQSIGKTAEELYGACLQEVLYNLRTKSIDEIIKLLRQYNFNEEKALELWNILGLSVDTATNVTVFYQILSDLKYTLDNITYLGILTNNSVVINAGVYESHVEHMHFSKIYAKSLTGNITVALKVEEPYYEHLATLSLEENNFTFAEVGTVKDHNLKDCILITLENDTLISRNVNQVFYDENGYHLSVNLVNVNLTDVVRGSPLICARKVYGLADGIHEDKIDFDTFTVKLVTMTSTAFVHTSSFGMLVISLLTCLTFF